MLSLAHTVISLPFGIFLQHPVLIFLSTFTFHFVLDAIYHWNIHPPSHDKFPVLPVALDITGGLLLAWIIIGSDVTTLPILAAILGGNTPDILQTIWSLSGKPRNKRLPHLTYLFDLHHRIQWETKNITTGLIPQLTIVILVILLIS